MILGGLDHLADLFRAADIAGIDAQAGGTGFGCLNAALVMEMDVGHDRDGDILNNGLQGPGRFHIRAGNPHNVGTGFLDRLNLADGGLGVTGQCVGHGLHGYRRAAANCYVANHDLAGFPPVNIAIGPNTHGQQVSIARGQSARGEKMRPMP